MISRFFAAAANMLLVGSVFVAAANAQDPVVVYLHDVPEFGDLDAAGFVGGTGQFQIGIRTPILVTGVHLDVRSSNPDVASFTGSIIENPIIHQENPRWTGAQPGEITPTQVRSIEASALKGFGAVGIDPYWAAYDGAYDAATDTFHFATIDYEITGVGQADIELLMAENAISFYYDEAPIQIGAGGEIVDNVVGASAVAGSITGIIHEPGDMNGDGLVNGFDFLTWQCDTSLGDLADWEANYGTPSTADSAAAPEPSGIVLAIIGLAAWCSRRRHRERAEVTTTNFSL